MVIRGIKQTLPGVYEITPDAGSVFFLRAAYLSIVSTDVLEESVEFSDEQWADILNAALVFSAERLAMRYLSRAEQCRAGLYSKLIKKDVDKASAQECLDFLEKVGYLNDERFAGAWLRSRSTDHCEGRLRLSVELTARNVERTAASKALDEFFSENDEKQICARALEKYCRLNGSAEGAEKSLIRKGFSYKMIRNVILEYDFSR